MNGILAKVILNPQKVYPCFKNALAHYAIHISILLQTILSLRRKTFWIVLAFCKLPSAALTPAGKRTVHLSELLNL